MPALFSGNILKIIAAISMLIDHGGMVLFPDLSILRIIGRLAFPIYAFMISEGCKYTRNRLRYFLSIFLLGGVCQIVYFLFSGSTYLSILITFSLSILMIYALQLVKRPPLAHKKPLFVLIFLASVAAVYILNQFLTIDYGFWGCMVPVFASLFHHTKRDSNPNHVLMLGIGLVLLAADLGGLQPWSLLALPLLLLYSGKRGKWNMKYFFYIFYPAHLVGIALVEMVLPLVK